MAGPEVGDGEDRLAQDRGRRAQRLPRDATVDDCALAALVAPGEALDHRPLGEDVAHLAQHVGRDVGLLARAGVVAEQALRRAAASPALSPSRAFPATSTGSRR